MRRAADFAEELVLRAYDSLHLAAADQLRVVTEEPVTFAVFDRGLDEAAVRVGLNRLGTE